MKIEPSPRTVPLSCLPTLRRRAGGLLVPAVVLLLLGGPAQAVIVEAPAASPAAAPDPATVVAEPAAPAGVAPPGLAAAEARIRAMHERLKITAAQEAPWRRVADVMREDAQVIARLAEARRQQGATLTAPEQLRSYAEISLAHAHGVTQLADAFDPLYIALSPAQKLTADRLFRHAGQSGAMHGSLRKHAS